MKTTTLVPLIGQIFEHVAVADVRRRAHEGAPEKVHHCLGFHPFRRVQHVARASFLPPPCKPERGKLCVRVYVRGGGRVWVYLRPRARACMGV